MVLKPCPEGKIRNPKTNRCIKDPAFGKTCPEGKVLNPKTNRCIIDRRKPKPKPTLVINPKLSSRSKSNSSKKETKRTFVVTVKGERIEFLSAMTDAEAHQELQALCASRIPRTNTFAHSLAAKSVDKLSATQIAWVHKLVIDAKKRAISGSKHAFPGIVAMFGIASQKLKHPQINFGTVRLEKLPSDHHRYQNEIYVTGNNGQYYYGRIDTNGSFHKGKNYEPDIATLLGRLETDPVGFAKEYGRLTGRCCFCKLPLNNKTSLCVGFGSTCARNYRLPYVCVE
jgi:hypothetical protein